MDLQEAREIIDQTKSLYKNTAFGEALDVVINRPSVDADRYKAFVDNVLELWSRTNSDNYVSAATEKSFIVSMNKLINGFNATPQPAEKQKKEPVKNLCTDCIKEDCSQRVAPELSGCGVSICAMMEPRSTGKKGSV